MRLWLAGLVISGMAFGPLPIVLPVQAAEPGFQFQQSYRGGVWSHDRSLQDEAAVATGQAWFRMTGVVSDDVSLSGEGWAELRFADGDGPRSLLELRELFIQWRSGPLRVRAGRQILAWGRSDRINPTDVASSRDLTALVSSDDEQRRGQATIRADLEMGGGYIAQAYWIPEFRPDRFGTPPVDGSTGPEWDWADQAALRVERTAGTVDWSVTLYRGPNHRPQLAQAGAPGEFSRIFPVRTMLGFDAATSFGDTTVRGEIAHFWAEGRSDGRTSSGQDWFAVLGADHEFTPNFYGNGQLIYAHSQDKAVCGPACLPLDSALTTANNVLALTTREEELGVSMMLAYQDDYQTRRFEISAVHLTQDQGLLVCASARFSLNDDDRLELGGDLYVGSDESLFGAQENRSAAFIQFAHGY